MSSITDKDKQEILDKLQRLDIATTKLDDEMRKAKTVNDLFKAISKLVVEEEMETGNKQSSSKAKEGLEKTHTRPSITDRQRKVRAGIPKTNHSQAVQMELKKKKWYNGVQKDYAIIENKHRTQADNKFYLVRDRKRGNQLHKTWDSIANSKFQRDLYKVTKEFKKKGLIFGDIGERLI